MSSKVEPSIPVPTLEALSKVLGEILTGSEISGYLSQAWIDEYANPTDTKWRRLFENFKQNQIKICGRNNVLRFITLVMHPSRFQTDPNKFQEARNKLNPILAYIGLELTESGSWVKVEKATTISEAKQRVDSFTKKLKDRNVHSDIYKYCNEELLAENYFHAVFEAPKSIFDRIRELTSLTEDGSDLIDKTLSINNPLIRINELQSKSEKSEHTGFSNLLKGISGMFRNTTAHSPKIKWAVNEEDAIDAMMVISFALKKLDTAVLHQQNTT